MQSNIFHWVIINIDKSLSITEISNATDKILFGLSANQLINQHISVLENLTIGANRLQATKIVTNITEALNNCFEYFSIYKGQVVNVVCRIRRYNDKIIMQVIEVKEDEDSTCDIHDGLIIDELTPYYNQIKSLFEMGNITPWIYDVKNKSFRRFFGVMIDSEIQTKEDCKSLIYPEDFAEAQKYFNLLVEGKSDICNFIIHIRKSTATKDYCSLSVKMSSYKDCTGKVESIIGIQYDITEIERLGLELNRSKKQVMSSYVILNEIIERVPEAMYVKEVSDSVRYIIANTIFCDMTGKSKQEIVGKTDFDVFEPEAAALYCEYDKKLIAEGKTVSYESTAPSFSVNKDYWYITKSIIKTSDDRLLIIGVAMNITKMHNINVALQQAKDKAEESDKLKSAFLANMSHEIRTPLNAIVGFSELIANSDNKEEKDEYAKIIKLNNSLLLRLINDILDLSKIESGLLDFKYEKFDVSEMLHYISNAISSKISNSKVKFLIESPYKSCIVYLDRNRIMQVGANFITNAIKYTQSGYIKIGYSYENEGLKIFVKDTGIGIDKEKHNIIFSRFEKLDEFAQGTGLGLSICKAIVDAQGGEIGFESELGEGSTFWAWLPTTADIIS